MTVALIVAVALLLWTTGLPMLINTAHAATLTAVSDTISDSDLGVSANHTLLFTTSSGVAASGTIVLTFPAGFAMNTLDFADLDLQDDAGDLVLAAAPSGSGWGATLTGQAITFVNGDTVVAAGSIMKVEIGLHASLGGAGNTQITNHASAGSYSIDITGSFGDTGSAMIAVIDDVTVSATVGTSFTFVIAGVNSGTSGVMNGESDSGGTTDVNTTAIAIPWGTLTAGSDYLAAQTLTVATNATNGYTVVVAFDQPLTSTAGDIIDFFNDGANVADPIAWADPAATLDTVTTYGHMGFTADDSNIGGTDDFGTAEYAGDGVAGDHVVLSHSGPSDGTTQDKGLGHLGFKLRISALQESGDSYTAAMTYVATPTF